VLLLLWQFDTQRRAGRIDRDNARRSDELMRMKDDFSAAVSHELRTPLTSILGYLELLQENVGQRSKDDEAYLVVVQRNAERLLRLVSDLLLVAQVEDSVLALQFGEVDLRDIARECLQAAKPAADRKGIELDLDARSPEVIHGDAVRIAQMMDNLVSNAIKFTPEGGRVTVTTASRDGDAIFEVTDTGMGISPGDQQLLYDRFFRTQDAVVQATPGTGLGLTITKAIVDAHGGTIEVRSTAGVGTTFVVTLPRARVTATAPASVRSDA
jgi:signal transduction histidine kinase